MSTFDADTTTLLEGISSQVQTASTWMTGPRSNVLLTLAGQLNDLLAGKSATEILGGPVGQQTDSAVQDAPDPDAVDTPAVAPQVPTNVAPATQTPDAPADPAPAAPDAPTG